MVTARNRVPAMQTEEVANPIAGGQDNVQSAEFPITLPALVGNPNAADERIRIFTVEIPASHLAEFYVEAAHAVQGGFQRGLDTSRAEKIGRIMAAETPNVHGGLLAYADESEIEYEPARGRGFAKITLKRPLRLIDGQHRAAGAQIAVKLGKGDYTETVRIVVGATRQELSLWYLRTNIEARKVAPSNIIVNVAGMSGTVMRRKSWIARLVIALSSDEPFRVDDKPLVAFMPRDGGMIGAQTLYRAIDALLPQELNREGDDTEAKAVSFAHRAFDFYAGLYDGWGAMNDKGFVESHAYGFTTLVAYARLYGAVYDPKQKIEECEALVAQAWIESGLVETLPETLGSGEKAAMALAAFAAGHIGMTLNKLGTAIE